MSSVFYQAHKLISYKTEGRLINKVNRATEDAIKFYEDECKFKRDAAGMKYFEWVNHFLRDKHSKVC